MSRSFPGERQEERRAREQFLPREERQERRAREQVLLRKERQEERKREKGTEGIKAETRQKEGESTANVLKRDLAKYRSRNHLTDEEKYNILQNRWARDQYNYPQTKFGDRRLRCYVQWERKYPWLHYSPYEDAAYCSVCITFNKQKASNTTFQKEGFRNWKNAVRANGEFSQIMVTPQGT